MDKLVGNLLVGQSGGSTSVINSSLAGVISMAQKHSSIIKKIYGMRFGVEGFMEEKIVDLTQTTKQEIIDLKIAPGSALGSTRHKLKDTDFAPILKLFRKYNIRYFHLIGGNDTMDTINRLVKYSISQGYEMRGIGVPKTVDNDLFGTDHTPGFGSCARAMAIDTRHGGIIARDMERVDPVLVMQTIGRDAGWLAAATALARTKKGDVSMERLNEACLRVLLFKERWARPNFEVKKAKTIVAKKTSLQQVKKMADESITLIRDADKLLPLRLKKKDKLLIIHPGFHRIVPSDQTNFYKPDVLKIAKKYFPDVIESVVGQQPTFSEIDSTLDLTVWSTHVIFMSINAAFNLQQIELLKKVTLFKPGKIITVALRSPTDIFAYPFSPTHLVTYGHNEEQLEALFRVITGKIKAQGKLPLSFDKKREEILKSKKVKRLSPLKETPRV